MKYLKAIFCTLLVAVILSGCSFRMSSSIEDLIAPVSPFGDNADIQEAMNSYAAHGYSLKTPSGGEYNASYNFYDFDNDGTDEAFVFYEPTDDIGTISMALIQKVDDKWSVVENIKGDGKDVYSLDFQDINGDNENEIIICWDAIKNSSNHMLSVYKINGEKSISLKKIGDSIQINNYIAVDFDKNNKNELLLFEINGTSSSVKAELYSLEKGKFDLLGATKLDSHITSYTMLQIENAEDDVRVYADAVGTDGSSMLTEIIYWSNSYNTIVSPFYDYGTGLTKETKRDVIIHSCDLNEDGFIEMPINYNGIKNLPKEINAVNWFNYKSTTLVHSAYSLVVDGSYLVVIPDKIIDKISVKYDEKNRMISVVNTATKKDVYSIVPVIKASYDKNEYSDYDVILEEAGYYYLAKLGNDSDIQISINDLAKSVKSIK